VTQLLYTITAWKAQEHLRYSHRHASQKNIPNAIHRQRRSEAAQARKKCH